MPQVWHFGQKNLLEAIMLLHHPLMSYEGLSNWPPDWVWIVAREEIEKRMDELARKYVETRDPEIIDELCNLRLELKRLQAQT
jgi:hypothetical protein